MALLIWRTFGGQRPRLSSRLLANDGAEIAINAKMWNGKLRPFKEGKDIFTTVKAGPIRSIFQYRYGGAEPAWLHWSTDVDVVTSPQAIDANFRLYYTGDGRPKITDKTIAAAIVRNVAAGASSGQPVFTITGPIKGFIAGDTVLIDYGSSVTQSATILTAVNGSPNSTITLTTNLANALSSGRPITNTSKRFPLGSYDLGVPAPAAALTATPAALKQGDIERVLDIEVTRIISMDQNENSVLIPDGITADATTFSYVTASFPLAVFMVGDQFSIGLVDTTVVGTVTDVDIVGSNTVVAFTPPFDHPLESTPNIFAVNASRGKSFSLEDNPTNLPDFMAASQRVFTADRAEGAEAIQIDVDSKFTITVSPGMISRYSTSVGPGGTGALRYTHFIRRQADNELLFQQTHVIDIKEGKVISPASDGENFRAIVVDTPPEGGTDYTVGTIVDRAELLFDPGPTINDGGIFIQHNIRVRRAGRVQLVLPDADHGLVVDDRIQLDLSPLDPSVAAIGLDGKTVKITKVDDDILIAEGQIGGKYAPGGTYKQVFQDDEISPRTYIYTYVVTIGGQQMEGGPSPPTDVIDTGFNQSVTVTGFVNPNTTDFDTNFTAIRLYRFQEADDGTGSFLFHSELAVNATTVNDTTPGDDLLEPITTIGYLPPPADLSGIIELPNGLIAGFSGKELLYPVPFQLHAWPVANRRAIHDAIVSIGSFGNSVAVTAAGIPRTFTGNDPETVSPDRIELVEPNMSKRGSVDMGYGYAYPGPRGLVLVTIGRSEVVTEDLFTRDEWQQLNPASFVACKFDDRYLCFYDTGGAAPSFTEHAKGGFIIDPKALDGKARLIFLDFWASEAWDDPDTSTAYIVKDGVVQEFDAGELGLEYTYRFKPQVLARAQEMTVMRVEGPRPMRVTVLVEESPGSTRMVPLYNTLRHDSEDFALPSGLFQRWQVEVRCSILEDLEGVYIADSNRELRSYRPGQ